MIFIKLYYASRYPETRCKKDGLKFGGQKIETMMEGFDKVLFADNSAATRVSFLQFECICPLEIVLILSCLAWDVVKLSFLPLNKNELL